MAREEANLFGLLKQVNSSRLRDAEVGSRISAPPMGRAPHLLRTSARAFPSEVPKILRPRRLPLLAVEIGRDPFIVRCPFPKS